MLRTSESVLDWETGNVLVSEGTEVTEKVRKLLAGKGIIPVYNTETGTHHGMTF